MRVDINWDSLGENVAETQIRTHNLLTSVSFSIGCLASQPSLQPSGAED